jgi:site-specific recombinase XerD
MLPIAGFTANTVRDATQCVRPIGIPTTVEAVTSMEVQFVRDGTVISLPVLLQDGKINAVVLAYLHWMHCYQGVSQRSLARHILGLQRFSTYWLRHGDRLQGESLLRGFFETLVAGDAELVWTPLRYQTAANYFDTVNMLADWLTDEGQAFLNDSKAVHPNPKVDRALGWYEQLAGFQRQVRTRMLAHLYPSTRKGRGLTKTRQVDPRRMGGKRITTVTHGSAEKKAMRFEEYHRLIRHEQNVRDLLLWLLLGAGGLRLSEPLHLFCTDIQAIGREADVVLAHPSEATVPTVNGTGRPCMIKRGVYLRDHYRLKPRNDLPLSNPLHAGWKGMAIEDSENLWSRVTWLLPVYGVLFWQAHVQYMKIRGRLAGSAHPYYFVNLRRNIGAPLTYENAKGTLERATHRLAIQGPQNPHSMRHMYGHTMQNRFGVPRHAVQRAMHHTSPESTEVYTQPTSAEIRKQLEAAQEREAIGHLSSLPALQNLQ